MIKFNDFKGSVFLDFVKFKALTRFEQSLFGLPIALTGALLPFFEKGFFASLTFSNFISFLFILPAFFAARISGMAFNQLVDSKIDALNPRTMKRPIPSRLVKASQAKTIAFGFLFLFLFFTYCIAPLCFFFSLAAAPLIFLYSYMKRVHYSCHFVLGIIHALSPIMAYLAIKKEVGIPSLFLGLGAFFFIAGNDIIYALQDLDFDRQQKLHSFPAHFGKEKSVGFSKILHLFSIFCFGLSGFSAHLPWIYYSALPLIFLTFRGFYQNFEKEPSAFFRCTVFVSASLFLSTLLSFLSTLGMR